MQTKLGEKRMKKYKERKDIEEISNDDDEYIIITAYQKIEPGEWEKIQIRKKRNK